MTDSPAAPNAADDFERSPLKPVRRRVAERLLESAQATVRASTSVECDFEAVQEIRQAHNAAARAAGEAALTFLPFIAFAAARAFREAPEVCAQIDLAEGIWVQPRRFNLGIAVASPAGLVVGVVHDADRFPVIELAQRIDDLSARIRSRRFTPADCAGGVMTLSNPGSFGSYFSQPVVNPGETAILCADGIARRAVVEEDRIVARLRAILGLAFDHRVVDGEQALSFLNHCRRTLETFDPKWMRDV